jgi:hypothetical protein
MDNESRNHGEKKKSSKLTFIMLGVTLLVFYPLSIPFYFLLATSMPVWMDDFFIAVSHIYDPIQWLYFNVDWVKDFYDWYEQFFPRWQ